MSGSPQLLRLDKLLANLGYGSRREIGAMAAAGRIALDGLRLRRADEKIAIDAGIEVRLLIDGQPIDPLPGLLLLLNKPLGVTCSHKEAGRLVYDLLPPRWRQRTPSLSAVGRLDKDTSGLLLMTDDGDFLHQVISPRARIEKRYKVTLDRPLTGMETGIFAQGGLLLDGEDKPLLPARLQPLGPAAALLAITEGRYHQVRRMFAALGNHVVALERVGIGGLDLPDDLPPGQFKRLDEAARARLFTSPAQARPAQTE